jgi:hypothetical protein
MNTLKLNTFGPTMSLRDPVGSPIPSEQAALIRRDYELSFTNDFCTKRMESFRK